MKKILLFIILFVFSNSITAQCYEQIDFGGGHTTAQKADGTLWGWGASSWGNLCTNNGNESEPNSIQLGTLTDWNSFKNGTVNTFAIKNNGTLWGCGNNQYGSLGVNSNTQQFNTFQQITTATNWVKVAPSYFFTLALKADGTIWAWGQNNNYQLGNSPATAQQLFPIQVGTATDWVAIATSHGDTAFAIKSNGTIWGWGANTRVLVILRVKCFFLFYTNTNKYCYQLGKNESWWRSYSSPKTGWHIMVLGRRYSSGNRG